ncbi:hypothetical protein GLOTRDRAFT_121851 [Gloeophyllum trabeum ATCC 11539]|uniref:F-box domain-containing protein n=1 Tax=Gloeophyllum trabeum (strain ATCC 11539 / FP-39264 / Madison 617) TaxID=670483 RepID=S7Q4G6_GLOTA|nr:uncharacterized protein GLOTRDRAFT_121851 [Gloeophyllum trabeum ATCC 11539]EPQ54911.1 hypothetical protein GLOTRDRAFT_121851 [Gloeophyllum trabeum ATCC 11539]
MPFSALPAEILNRIVSFVPVASLPSLCVVCRALQAPAQAKLYSTLQLGQPSQAFRLCSTLVARPNLAHLVKTAWFFLDPRRTSHRGALPQQYWLAVKAALTQTAALETLVLFDPTFGTTWVLDFADAPFQLTEAKLKLRWDTHLVRFLESQVQLKNLQIPDHPEPADAPVISPNALPALCQIEASSFIVTQLANCPLTNIQTVLSAPSGETLPRLLACLPKWRGLRSLNIIDLPAGPTAEEFNSETVNRIADSAPNLEHLGILPLPCMKRNGFHRALTRLYNLRTLELDLGAWVPQPSIHLQRALVMEMHIYRPTLQLVALWAGGDRRFDWSMDAETGEWTYYPHQNGMDVLWRRA